MKPVFRNTLSVVLSLLIATPAMAADNYTITSGGASRTIRAKEINGVLHPMSMAIDGAGLERFTASNPGYVLFPPGTVLPISATALPLPAGAATAAAQATGNAALGSPSDTAWDGVSGSASITAILKGLPRTTGGSGTATTLNQGTPGASPWPVTWATGLSVNADLRIGGAAVASGNPVPMSAASLPLPAGAATAANQATANTSLSSIAGGIGAAADAGWDGAAASASQTSILKAIWAKLSGLLTVDTVVRGSAFDRGGTITVGGTAQQFMAANSARRGWAFQNQSQTDLYVNCIATATGDFHSLRIPAGAYNPTEPHHVGTGACSVYGATTGQPFYAREF